MTMNYLQRLEAIEKSQRADHSKHTNEAQNLHIRYKSRYDEVECADYDDEKIKSVPIIFPIPEITVKA